MGLFKKKEKRPDTFPYPVKPVSIVPPPSPRMKVEAALQVLNEQCAFYDVEFHGIRYQRTATNPKSPVTFEQ